MRVVFVGIGAEQMPLEALSALAKRDGHQAELAFDPSLFDDRYHLSVPWLARRFDRREATVARAVALRPDVVAMSVLTNAYQWSLEMAREIKARTGARVILGGVHPSAVPELVIAESAVDAICVGEGDRAFPAYLAALEAGTLDAAIPNLWHKHDGRVVRGEQTGFEQDLDALPFFDKDLYADEIDVAGLYMTITGRGCPYRCTFCFNNFWAKLPSRSGAKPGRYVRQRSVDHVIAELRHAKRRYGIRFVDFEDDVFTVDKRWIQAFLERYRREIGVPWMCLTHPKYVDEDIVRWMKEAGCTWVQIGIQSVDEHYKHASMKRYEKQGDVAWAIDAFMRAGIGVKGDHIFGSPGEGNEAQRAALEFYAEHTPARISTYWMTYYPGVEMTADALARGLLSEEEVRRMDHGDVHAFHHTGVVKDPLLLRQLANHEIAFRFLPAVPQRLRKHVRPEWLSPIPLPLLSALSTAADVAVGFAQQNPEHLAYARHYLTHLYRHARGAARVPEVRTAPAAAPSAPAAPLPDPRSDLVPASRLVRRAGETPGDRAAG